MSSLTRMMCGVLLAALGVMFASEAVEAQPRRPYHHHRHYHHHYHHHHRYVRR